LILEYLDGDLPHPDYVRDPGYERRTSLLLPYEVFESFSAKAEVFKMTKSRIVSGLTHHFLRRRNVDSDVFIDYRSALTGLVEACINGAGYESDEYSEALSKAMRLLGLDPKKELQS